MDPIRSASLSAPCSSPSTCSRCLLQRSLSSLPTPLSPPFLHIRFTSSDRLRRRQWSPPELQLLMPEQGWPAAGYSCCCIGSIPVWLAADAIALDRPLSLRIVCQPWPLIADLVSPRVSVSLRRRVTGLFYGSAGSFSTLHRLRRFSLWLCNSSLGYQPATFATCTITQALDDN